MVCALLTLAALWGCVPVKIAQTVLLFAGSATSANDVRAIRPILDTSRIRYSTANSFQLKWMSDAQLAKYKLLIVPGGTFVRMSSHLTRVLWLTIG
jgi:hypothetical protein